MTARLETSALKGSVRMYNVKTLVPKIVFWIAGTLVVAYVIYLLTPYISAWQK